MLKTRLLLICLCLFLSERVLAADIVKLAWAQWRTQFVETDGRVVDTGQGGISHSEGQGFGLILAANANDKANFLRIWEWTHTHMQVRGDALFSWRWDPKKQQLTDANDASDADMLIAWGLILGADRFARPDLRDEAKKILTDVRQKLFRKQDSQIVVLPGNAGFELPAGQVLNLSYWIYPAFSSFNQVDPTPEWNQLRDTGLAYLDQAHFGRWNLPPDWLLANGKSLTLAPNHSVNFGYDAIRIPLYLKWARLATPERTKSYMAFWRYFNGASFVPAWTDLQDNSVDSYNAAPGIQAIQNWILNKPLPNPIPLKNEDYYSASLKLLTWIAANTTAHP